MQTKWSNFISVPEGAATPIVRWSIFYAIGGFLLKQMMTMNSFIVAENQKDSDAKSRFLPNIV